MTVITRDQKKHFRTEYTDDEGNLCVLIATLRYDDECKNGHNTFAITGEAKTKHSSGKTLWLGSCGCIHDDIAKHIPELAPYIKWHLVSSDGPMHYIANSMYYAKAKDANLEAARSCAVWPDAQLEDFTKEKLAARLPALMEEFRRDVEKLGFTY